MRVLWPMLLLTALCSGIAQPARPEYFLVKSWRLAATWSYAKHYQTVQQSGDTVYTHAYDATVQANAEFKLVQARSHTSRHYLWETEKGARPTVSVQVQVTDSRVIKPKHGKESWDKQETSVTAPRVEDGEASLRMDPMTGAYELHADFMNEPSGFFRHTNSEGGSLEVPVPVAFTSGPLGCQGMASGMTFGGVNSDGTMAGASLDNPAGNLIQFQWMLTPWEKDPAGEATFDLVDHEWMPRPDSIVEIEVTWKGKAEKVKVTLSGISREPGTCMNSLETSEGEDLVIEKQGPWGVEKEGSREALSYVALRVLPKENPPQAVSLQLKAKDYGAYGKLQCEVFLDGKWRKAKATGAESLNVPYDINDNHIADAWEKQEGVSGYPETWDEAEVEGQTAKGDGLPLYAKYRGVRTADQDWTRLKAKEKTHFVIDPGGVFDPERWRKSTGIRAYKVTEEMTRGGKMDFNARTAEGAGKYAVHLELKAGTKEESTDDEGNVEVKDQPRQYAYTIGNTPRTTEACRIFPDRIRAMIVRVATLMRVAVTDPVTPEEQEEAKFLQGLGIPFPDIKRILDAQDKVAREALTQRMVALCAIHEMGHACGVPGHLNAKGEEDQDVQRDPKCPSQYLDPTGRRRFVLFGQLGGDGSFCKSSPDNCWSHLNVKD